MSDVPDPNNTQFSLALIHEGWAHLKLQRPLAAWASWKRALRVDPTNLAAQQAIDRLKTAEELPETARLERKFRTPADAAARERWNRVFEGRDLGELPDAAEAFSEILVESPKDADALENRALCFAWLGKPEAIADLSRVIELTAMADFDRAVSAAKLAGILRQGAGAETEATDFSEAVDLSHSPGLSPVKLYDLLQKREYLRRLPAPREHADIKVDEWLDRPWPEETDNVTRLGDLPRVLGVVLSSDKIFRVSSPDPHAFWKIVATLKAFVPDFEPTRTPLPLPMLDAAVWTIRIPEWVNDQDRRRLYRENVEDFYENRWINRLHSGLLSRTPLEASVAAQKGEVAERARLEGAIAIREELAARPDSLELYQGYPFDRLRKRLELPINNPEAVNEGETGSMSGGELDTIDPKSLDDHALVEAFNSAAALHDDSRTVKFAHLLVDKKPSVLANVDLKQLFAPLIREAIAEGEEELAQERIDQAIDLDQTFGDGKLYAEFNVWKAELLCGLEQPDAAAEIYRELAATSQLPWVAFDGATTLYDAGYFADAKALAEQARDLAEAKGDHEVATQAGELLERLEDANEGDFLTPPL